jgi:hypothetical protein
LPNKTLLKKGPYSTSDSGLYYLTVTLIFSNTLPEAEDRKLIGVEVQALPDFLNDRQRPLITGTGALKVLLTKLSGTVAVEYSWILLLIEMLLRPSINQSPDVAVILLHSALVTETVGLVTGKF